MAYTIACLGVTENDWETLGKQALESLDLEVAKKAYTRLKDLRHLELITDLEQRKNRDEDQVLIADIAAFQVQILHKSKKTGAWKGKLMRVFVNPKEVKRAKNGTNII